MKHETRTSRIYVCIIVLWIIVILLNSCGSGSDIFEDSFSEEYMITNTYTPENEKVEIVKSRTHVTLKLKRTEEIQGGLIIESNDITLPSRVTQILTEKSDEYNFQGTHQDVWNAAREIVVNILKQENHPDANSIIVVDVADNADSVPVPIGNEVTEAIKPEIVRTKPKPAPPIKPKPKTLKEYRLKVKDGEGALSVIRRIKKDCPGCDTNTILAWNGYQNINDWDIKAGETALYKK